MARVSVGRQFHSLYQDSTKKEAGRPALFPTMKDFFMYNFAIGVRNGVPANLEGSVDVFGTEIFSQDDIVLLYAVYLADTKDLRVLEKAAGDSQIAPAVLELAEQYAQAGASITERQWTPQKQEITFSYLLLDPEM